MKRPFTAEIAEAAEVDGPRIPLAGSRTGNLLSLLAARTAL